MPGTGETVRAIRTTLVTLGQRISEGNAEGLAASLPLEIKWYLTGAVHDHGLRALGSDPSRFCARDR